MYFLLTSSMWCYKTACRKRRAAMKKSRWARLVARIKGITGLAVFFCLPEPTNAQLGMATLGGMVNDPSGAGVPNAQVTLESTIQRWSRQVVTDSTGAYSIGAIP